MKGEIFYSLKEAQMVVENWRVHYNTRRPHSARGYRPPADTEALVEVLLAFSNMVIIVGPALEEADINPLFVLPEGRGVVAADGVFVMGDMPAYEQN